MPLARVVSFYPSYNFYQAFRLTCVLEVSVCGRGTGYKYISLEMQEVRWVRVPVLFLGQRQRRFFHALRMVSYNFYRGGECFFLFSIHKLVFIYIFCAARLYARAHPDNKDVKNRKDFWLHPSSFS